MNDSADEALVARELAALRGSGWEALKALEYVAPAVPKSALRDRLEQSAARLRAGDALGAGLYAAPAEALLAHAEARELAFEASIAAEWTSRSLTLIGVLAVALAAGAGAVYQNAFGQLEHGTGTELVLQLMKLARYALGFVVVFAAWAWRKPLSGLVPGVRELVTAATLLSRSAAMPAAGEVVGEDPRRGLVLDLFERRWFEVRSAQQGGAAAARELASEVALQARLRLAAYQRWAPVLGALVVWTLAAVTLAALEAPVLGVASKIQ